MKIAIILPLALLASTGSVSAPEAQDGTAMRHAAELMSTPPYVEFEGGRAWVVEKSKDFGVVLYEIRGPVPLHLHPDGNRRMLVVEGELEMLGGTHTMHMKPGDYMYLPRDHHHKVRLAAGSRALFVTVDNPPVASRNVVWIEPAPPLKYDQSQLERASITSARCNQ